MIWSLQNKLWKSSNLNRCFVDAKLNNAILLTKLSVRASSEEEFVRPKRSGAEKTGGEVPLSRVLCSQG